jgi:lantibiotic modifying enzyme
MLYQKNRHVGVIDYSWNAPLAEATIKQILATALTDYSPEIFWPMPEIEKWGDNVPTSIYQGAMGVLWSIDYLDRYVEQDFPFDVGELAGNIHKKYFASEAVAFSKHYPGNEVSSYLQGETGILLAKSKLIPAQADEIWERQYPLIQANINNPTMESYWGGTGSLIPVLFKLEEKVTERWLDLLLAHCQFMKETIDRDAFFDCPVWTQDLYGTKQKLTGAGHGFVGNMYPFLRGLEFLTKPLKEWVLNDSIEMVVKTAQLEGACCNWPTELDRVPQGSGKHLLQWCHGAPGVITSLNNIHAGYSREFDELMIKAGETIWQAGPLTKGISICHGTNGNGFALLKLFKRTGDEKWLERARAFAIHAINQSKAKYSLWDGDLGLAFFLHSCLSEDDRIPLLDVI